MPGPAGVRSRRSGRPGPWGPSEAPLLGQKTMTGRPRTPPLSTRACAWAASSRAKVAATRRVRALNARSAEYWEWWADYRVAGPQQLSNTLDHPTAGRLTVDISERELERGPPASNEAAVTDVRMVKVAHRARTRLTKRRTKDDSPVLIRKRRSWRFGWVEVEHDVQSECADLGEQVCGQDTVSLTVLATEAKPQLQVAVGRQARQLVAMRGCEFHHCSYMVREVTVVRQPASSEPDAGLPSSAARVTGAHQAVPLELLVRRDPQTTRDLTSSDRAARDPDRPGRPSRDRRGRLHQSLGTSSRSQYGRRDANRFLQV